MLVRRLRRERAWTQEQLALILGVSVRTVQRLEGGARPSLETAQALAGAFGGDARRFLGEGDVAAQQIVTAPVRPRWAAVARSEAVAAPAQGEAKRGLYAAAYLLVGGALASILILALLIAGPGSPALLAPLLACVICVGMAVRGR